MQAILSYFFELDDIVDSSRATSVRRDRLGERHEEFRAAMATGRSDDDRLRFVVHAMRALELPVDLFEAQFGALVDELRVPTPIDFTDWRERFEPSAAIYASVSANVLDLPAPEAWTAFRDLALGLNLVDLIYDLPHDLEAGRVLMPREDLERFDVDLAVHSSSREWCDLVRFEVERARTLVTAGSRVFTLPGAERAWNARLGVAIFSERLDAIERRDYDVFAPRSPLARVRELGVGLRAVAAGLVARVR